MKKKRKKLGDILPKYTLDDVIESEEEKEAIKEAEAEIEGHIERLQGYIGRELIGVERSAILDIVGDHSTKDEDGNIVLYFSFIQAWKIYQEKIAKRRRKETR